MPSSNHTISVAFKVSNSVHAAVYQWLYDQADSPSELMRAAVIAIYGYRAIEQTDAPPEKKMMALLESNAELSKLLELNKAIASITPGALSSISMPSVNPSSAMNSERINQLTLSKADDEEDWDDDTPEPLRKSEESKPASEASTTEDPTDLL